MAQSSLLSNNFWPYSDNMLIQPKILHYSVPSATLIRVCCYWNVVVLHLCEKGLTRRCEHIHAGSMLLCTGEIVLFSCSIWVGLLDSASAKIKAIGAQLPAEFYLLASHSLHRISWHTAALVCEACDRCCLLQDIDSKLQWCYLCGPVESFCGGAVCQCSCLQVQCPGHAKESLCLTFLLHLCSPGLLVVAQKVPRSHKRNVGG